MSNIESLRLADECDTLVLLLQEINPTLNAGKVNVKKLIEQSTAVRQSVLSINDMNSRLVSQRAKRDDNDAALQSSLISMRDMVRTEYGADSPEYERAGRTPLSKRGRASARAAKN